jgi:hypothetical protein
MSESARKLGFSVSLIALLAFIFYTVCFAAILAVNEPFMWESIFQLAKYEADSVIWLKYAGMGCMIVYACAFVTGVLCIQDGLERQKKIFGSIAAAFSAAFCACTCISYYVQLTSTRLQLQSGISDGLVQFTQSYNISGINGINMLGWTLFYGIASLALAFVFDATRLGKVTKVACIGNFAIMFAGMIGYILNNFNILLITMNLGLGAAGFIIIICFMLYFKKPQP